MNYDDATAETTFAVDEIETKLDITERQFRVWFAGQTKEVVDASSDATVGCTYAQWLNGWVTFLALEEEFAIYAEVDTSVTALSFVFADVPSWTQSKFNFYDSNGDGSVDIDEYAEAEMDFQLFYEDSKHWWLQAITPDQAMNTIGAFMVYADTDSSGFITVEEFYTVFDRMGPWAEEENYLGLNEEQVAAYDSDLVFENLSPDAETGLVSFSSWWSHSPYEWAS